MFTEEDIIGQITLAFTDVQRPMGSEIARSPDDLDGREAIARFENKEAAQLDNLVEEQITSAEDLYYLTPQAIRYFLPCYLRYVLRTRPYWEYSIVAGLIDFLDREAGVNCGVVYPDFTADQRLCVKNGLQFIEENLERYDLGEAGREYRDKLRVLASKWSP